MSLRGIHGKHPLQNYYLTYGSPHLTLHGKVSDLPLSQPKTSVIFQETVLKISPQQLPYGMSPIKSTR